MLEISGNHPLKNLNTFGIEAYAQEYTELCTDEDLIEFIRSRQSQLASLFILGGGSNILLTGDVQGTVAKIGTRGREIVGEDADSITLRIASGEDWDELVEYCVANGWGGLETLSGIPGQVGSSPIQNIGAYGAELKDCFVSLEAINRCTGELIHFDAERCQFGYRDSIFKRALKGRVVISHVTLKLKKRPLFTLSYQALKQKLAHIPQEELSLRIIRDAVLEIRASKLPDPKLLGNAGSFFKNPVVSVLILEKLKERFPEIVYFDSSRFAVRSSRFAVRGSQFAVRGSQDDRLPMDNGRQHAVSYKLAAGWLIEQCGWKGYRNGDAGVHKDQALVLVNFGAASGKDILALSEKIRQSVLEKFGITLEQEVNII